MQATSFRLTFVLQVFERAVFVQAVGCRPGGVPDLHLDRAVLFRFLLESLPGPSGVVGVPKWALGVPSGVRLTALYSQRL